MRRADRLFDIIQILRRARRPMTAARIARELEVAPRTIYRDIALLQARRVPIEGEAGLGYVMRSGFDLPPLMFSPDEIEAIVVGALLTRRTGDPGLQSSADRVLAKIAAIVPSKTREDLEEPPFYVSPYGVTTEGTIDLGAVRSAIRDARKLRFGYVDAKGSPTERTIWPVAVAYFVEVALVCGWCELRDDFRHFRADRMSDLRCLDDDIPIPCKRLVSAWERQAGWKAAGNSRYDGGSL